MIQELIVTGAAGFIGSQVLKQLAETDVKVTAVDDLSLLSQRPYLRSLPSDVVWMDRKEFYQNLASIRPAPVVHVGAISSTDEQRWDLLQSSNIDASQMLWRWCAQNSQNFVYASSAATYGNGSLGFDDDPRLMRKLEPLNLYGKSKKLFDDWVLDQWEQAIGSSPPRFCGLKFFNVYGPGESHKGAQASVVHHAFLQIRSTQKLKLFKSARSDIQDGHQSRDFVYIGDVVDVVLAAASGRLSSGIFNVGSGRARTFLDLAHAAFEALGVPPRIEWVDTPEHLKAHYQYWTEAKLNRLRFAGWTQEFADLTRGVRLTFDEMRK